MKLVVNIDVPALEPAIEFYCRALPLRLSRILDDDVAELTGAAATLYLLCQPAGSPPADGVDDGRRYTRHWTPVHLDFVVDDVEQAATRAQEAGAIRETECIHWRGSACISFSDPFGHGFCLIEFDGQTYGDDA